eukprot:5223939-Prymnesium_polylepis.1
MASSCSDLIVLEPPVVTLAPDEKLYNPFRVRAKQELASASDKPKAWRSSQMLQTAVGKQLVALRSQGVELSFRERVFLFLNEPGSSRSASRLGRLMQLILLGSAVTCMFETVTNVTYATGADLWIGMKVLFNIIFTLEMVLRLATYVPCVEAGRDPYVLLDVLSVVPFWVRVTLYGQTMAQDKYLTKEGAGMGIRVLEAVSSVRLLKLC